MNRDDVIKAVKRIVEKECDDSAKDITNFYKRIVSDIVMDGREVEVAEKFKEKLADAIMELQEKEVKVPEWENEFWKLLEEKTGGGYKEQREGVSWVLAFIRTEIIEKICEEIKSGLHDEDKFWPNQIKAKWLKGD